MAINNQYIKDFLINYWDNYGSLDGLSKNAPKIYQLILARRKKAESTKPVNDYIYSALGVQPRGNLGEELTFEINNYLQTKGSLINFKKANFYPALKRLAKTYEVDPLELLVEAGYQDYIEIEETEISYKNLATYYRLTSKLFKTTLDPKIGVLLDSYLKQNGSFNNLEQDEPNLFNVVSQLINIPIGKPYADDLTNAECIYTNKHIYFKESEKIIPNISNQSSTTKELLYGTFNGSMNGNVLLPSMVFSIRQHLQYFKTLYNMHKTNPRLYALLKRVYLNEGTFKSLADMLSKEGFYYPELSVASTQYIPCSDRKHIVFVSNQNSQFILMDAKTLSIVNSSNMEDKIIIASNDETEYVALLHKEGKKLQNVPLHMFITGNIDTQYLDGNLLNVSFDNLVLPS